MRKKTDDIIILKPSISSAFRIFASPFYSIMIEFKQKGVP